MDHSQLKNVLDEIVSYIPHIDGRAKLYNKINHLFPKVTKVEHLAPEGLLKKNIYSLDQLKEIDDSVVILFDNSIKQRERIASYCCNYAKNHDMKFRVLTDQSGYRIVRKK